MDASVAASQLSSLLLSFSAPGVLSITSKFLIRLETEAEAYRLVRKMHETYYEPDVFDKRYRVRAQVIH